MIYAAAGTTFEATAQGFPTGLVGTIGVRLLDNVGATTTARVTAGIAEYPAASGFYTVTMTAPATTGQYSVLWDTGVVSPSTTAAEDIIVTFTGQPTSAPAGFDLTTVTDVRAYLQKPGTDSGQDAIIGNLITRASRLILNWTGREFAPATTGGTQTYWYQGGGWLSLAPYDLRSAGTVTIDTETPSPSTLTANLMYFLEPLPTRFGVYEQFRFAPGLEAWVKPRQVTVVGDWGFATVPDDVAQACISTVSVWMRRDIQAFSASFNVDEGHLERPEALPSGVKGLLTDYRRIGAA